jgi:sugar (pentulose or hexulose) kinase
MSDVLRRKIRVVNDPRFATVNGAAMMAAVGLGILKFSDLRSMGEPYVDYEPDQNLNSVYDDKFNQFMEYFRNNRKSMRKYNAK